MITSFLMYVFLSVLNLVVGLFPTASSIPEIDSTFVWITTQLHTASAIFPVDTMLVVLGFVVAFELSILAVKSIVFVVGFIRGGH